jgi:hypothetical protein
MNWQEKPFGNYMIKGITTGGKASGLLSHGKYTICYWDCDGG